MANETKKIPTLPEEMLKRLPKLATITDRFGNTFHYGNAGGYWHIPLPLGADTDYRTHARNIIDMEIRPDDVMICSYPKTGLHWHQEIVGMLMHKTEKLDAETENSVGFLDARPIHVFSTRQSPRLLVTHVPFRYLPKQALEKKIKIIYLDRNPKDVLVSFYNHVHKHVEPLHYPGTFEHFVYLNLEVGYMYGDMFTYLKDWQDGIDANPDVPIYRSVYEDMKLDEKAGLKKLNEFLGTGCSEELCEKIAEACSFDSMKPFKETTASPIQNSLFRDQKTGFYRKGDVGDWKNWFSVTLNEEFDAEYKKHMSGYRTVYKYTLD
ncbi:sulfotransferase 1E1-like isoform X3 [Physella acuta]|uniref:sulfotransferase 1E1-like isoform X3 n=1 Tax=Physella acuta TaxID=109671 RepID=UPI0027DB4D93|nr:sulfotransferase 1E1-like isoform X3 [Physella acuta]